MNFKTFLENISKIKNAKLGGLATQLKMTPLERKQLDLSKIVAKNPKKAAVLMLIYPNKKNETCFLLTERASYQGTHSAQISFPGGKISESDASLEQTALRETFEEVNVLINEITVVKALTKTYIPPSNFWVYPFIGFVNEQPNFKKNYEVEALLEIKFKELLNNDNITSIKTETSYMKKVEVPCFKFDNQIVWGATAMILIEIKEMFAEILLKNE